MYDDTRKDMTNRTTTDGLVTDVDGDGTALENEEHGNEALGAGAWSPRWRSGRDGRRRPRRRRRRRRDRGGDRCGRR